MERIASFCVDHTRLERGMYLSRQDGDVLTWDIRMKKPNQGDYLTTAAAHTLEHLFATYARNSAVKDGVIYVGPMGCRTGFYLLTRGLTHHREGDAHGSHALRIDSAHEIGVGEVVHARR